MYQPFADASALIRSENINGANLAIVAIGYEAFCALRTARAESHELTTKFGDSDHGVFLFCGVIQDPQPRFSAPFD
ncbi:MAG TPA: hypothetical protein VGD63_03500 [Steroidobacteraceae bacterium]